MFIKNSSGISEDHLHRLQWRGIVFLFNHFISANPVPRQYYEIIIAINSIFWNKEFFHTKHPSYFRFLRIHAHSWMWDWACWFNSNSHDHMNTCAFAFEFLSCELIKKKFHSSPSQITVLMPQNYIMIRVENWCLSIIICEK
jgi:hypothetical protein